MSLPLLCALCGARKIIGESARPLEVDWDFKFEWNQGKALVWAPSGGSSALTTVYVYALDCCSVRDWSEVSGIRDAEVDDHV